MLKCELVATLMRILTLTIFHGEAPSALNFKAITISNALLINPTKHNVFNH